MTKFFVSIRTMNSNKWCWHYQQFIENKTWRFIAKYILLCGPLCNFSAFLLELFVQIIQKNLTFKNMLVEQIFRRSTKRTAEASLCKSHSVKDDTVSLSIGRVYSFVQTMITEETNRTAACLVDVVLMNNRPSTIKENGVTEV